MGEKPHLKKKKKPDLVRVRPGHESTRWVDHVVASTGLLTNPDQSSHQAGFNNNTCR
jgi:hypothetical protein